MDLIELMMFNEGTIVMEACKDFVKAMEENEISYAMKQSAWCMLCDMLFKEDSTQIAEEAVKHIKEVNEKLGTL